ncbi:MAG: 50S ribosomal protein L32e [Candidatus Methanomethylophilus sp.]|nr:50S ribosomal protein L32e [Methanomethylophilus sp.]
MTAKKFTDLKGFKDENVAELESIGIRTMEELAEALNDETKVKEIVKTLSGVGPKTVMAWKEDLSAESKPSKETKEEPKSEVVEEKKYVPSIKPELDKDTTEALAKRAVISGRRPAFKRQEWFRYSKLGESWRRPKGIHSKMKRNLKRRPPVVDIGFRGPAEVRGLHPSGFEEVMVYNVEGLEGIDPKSQAVRIGGTVGTKKRIVIQERADELGIRVLNRMV